MIKIIESFCVLILGIYIIYYLLNIFQQEHYNAKKFLKILKTFYFKKAETDILYIYLLLSIFDNGYLIFVFLLLTIFILLKKQHFVIKLKFTKRIGRILTLYIVLNLLFFIFIKKHLILLIVLLFLSPFMIILTNIVLTPLEKLIKMFYLQKAKRKINENKQVKIIGITGSFGKTTVKNILKCVLEESFITLATPKSYNTLMGIAKTINQSFNKSIEILILELGAYKIGEIKQITKHFKLDIAIITEVGMQHIETFKTLDNILKAKLEITSNLNHENALVVNGDNPLLQNLNLPHVKKIYRAGKNQNNCIFASDILENETTTFMINNKLKIKTRLLASFNINNILICYAAIKALKEMNINVSDDEFKVRIENMMPVENRLEYKKINNIHIYNDSYNANIIGFKEAIRIACKEKRKKVVITPGIVDSGKQIETLNKQIAKELFCFDDIYLIKNEASVYIEKVLKGKKNYYICKSFKEAYNDFLKKHPNEEVSLLIENDLPDNYLER